MSKKTYGFTIVELLIVIVVIAILASISFLSYQGLTENATRSVILTDMNSAQKSIALEKIKNDKVPTAEQIRTGQIKLPVSINSKYGLAIYCSSANQYRYIIKTDKFTYALRDDQTISEINPSQIVQECADIGVARQGITPADMAYPGTIFCSLEDQSCNIDKQSTILYGAHDRLNRAERSSTFHCGGMPGKYPYDPAPGILKFCLIANY